jgi:uncharacterized protein YbjT (DUF2867 family)
MTILITGATGSVGRLVVGNLLNEGRDVRALTRDPGSAGLPESVNVVDADLGDPATFTPELFADVDAVFLFPTDAALDPFVDAAVAAGVGRFVVLSSLAVSAEFARDIGSASNVHHTAVEKAVTSRTDGWTMLRPGTFANNLLSWAYPITTTGRVTAPYIGSAQTPVHEADVAEVAALVLTTPGHDGKVYEITGPESLTRVEQVAAISAAIDREIELDEITPEQFREDVARFVAPDVIDMLLDYWSDTVATPDVPKLTYTDLTGKPGRTLAQWARDHKEAFGG